MVLLTSSAVSAALSAGIVCTFTFLLFLSGYVLQQQTVRSLQEAIRNPPEKPWYPKPTLPPQFLEDNDTLGPVDTGSEYLQAVIESDSQESYGKQDASEFGQSRGGRELQEDLEPSPLQLWREHVAKSRPASNNVKDMNKVAEEDDYIGQDTLPHGRSGKYAYILSIPSTTDLCSVVVFTKWHRQMSKVLPRPNIVYIYPASWELSDSPIHTGAMDLIREMQDKHGVVCHPVSISRIWTGVSVESQLLGELQRTRWTYDRAMYFRSPGIALDITAMDRALTASVLNKSWQGLSSKTTSLSPHLLMYVNEKGLQAPRGVMRGLTVLASALQDTEYMDADGAAARNAAYVIFDEKDLRHRSRSEITSSGIFERFDRERRTVCAGTPILTRYDEDDRRS